MLTSYIQYIPNSCRDLSCLTMFQLRDVAYRRFGDSLRLSQKTRRIASRISPPDSDVIGPALTSERIWVIAALAFDLLYVEKRKETSFLPDSLGRCKLQSRENDMLRNRTAGVWWVSSRVVSGEHAFVVSSSSQLHGVEVQVCPSHSLLSGPHPLSLQPF